ncbi:hypothetical protein BaRGS_00026657, partial [Batillaria attramentaria]
AVTGKKLAVKPVKIVAGHEPELTNEFLQALATAINAKVDNDEYVKKVLSGGGGGGAPVWFCETQAFSFCPAMLMEKHRKEDKERSRERDKDKDRERKERHKDRDGEGDGDKEKERHRDRDRREKSRDGEDRSKSSSSPRKKPTASAQSKGSSAHSQNQQPSPPVTETGNSRKHRDPRKKAKAAPVVKHTSSPAVSSEVSKSSPHQSLKTHASSPTIVMNTLEAETESSRSEATGTSSVGTPAGVSTEIPPVNVKGASSGKDAKKRPGDASADGAAGDSQKRPAGSTVRNPNMEKHLPSSSEAVVSEDPPKTLTSRRQFDPTKPKPYHKAPQDVIITEPSPRGTSGQSKQPKGNKTKSEKAVVVNKFRGEVPGRQAKPSPSKVNLQNDTPPSQGLLQGHGRSNQQKKHKEEKENESPEQNGEKESSHETPSRLQRPTSAKGSRRRRQGREARDDEDEEFQQRPDENHEPTIGEDDLPPQITAARKMARPPSARPAPPRPKQDGVEAEPSMRLGTGAPTNLIVDNEKQSDDEDENFLVEESAPPPPPPEPVSAQAEAEDDAEHGALVKKMLESKKEAEQQQAQPTKKTEIERPAMSDTQRRKQREMVAKEIERLQTSIQSLTRSANPLGKIMDYVQEDLDSMQKELDRWRTENKEHALALRRERNVTDRAIEPLKAQLAELDRAIADQLDLIAATKSNILRNDQKAGKMLQSLARS